MTPLAAYHHALAAWLDAAVAVQVARIAGRPVSAHACGHADACRRRLDDARDALCGQGRPFAEAG